MLSSDAKYFIKLFVSQNIYTRFILGHLLLASAYGFYKVKKYWLFSKSLGKYEKLFETSISQGNSNSLHRLLSEKRKLLICGNTSNNQLYDSFKKSKEAKSIKLLYSKFSEKDKARIRYQNEDSPDREGNLLVLKEFDKFSQTKGVLYLQYNQSIIEFAALFDLPKIYEHYHLVVEPSSWGYSDIGLEILLQGNNKLFVMAQDEIDFNISTRLDERIVPIRAGAGDWINTTIAKNNDTNDKLFDVCMIASWRKLKNHKLMFKHLATLGAGLRIALIGYPWENRTAASIRKEQKKYYPDSLVSIFESVPHDYVFRVLSHSRVALMLSEREGANRGIYEALASNVPVIMLASNRGVNKDLITKGCITPATPEELSHHVGAIINAGTIGDVREKLLAISGTQNTWNKIKAVIFEHTGVSLSETSYITSTPNLRYVDARLKAKMDDAFLFIESFLSKD